MPEDTQAFRARASHRKSHSGCDTCKRRRVKCDEGRPICLNCSRRTIDCSYTAVVRSRKIQVDQDRPNKRHNLGLNGSHVQPSSSSPGGFRSAIPDGAVPSGDWNAETYQGADPSSVLAVRKSERRSCKYDSLDMRLMHWYDTCIASLFASEGRNPTKWAREIPRIAFGHPFVLHGLLAVSALHLSLEAQHGEQLILVGRAEAHHALALSEMVEAFGEPTKTDPSALFSGAMFLTFYIFGAGPREGQYLAFSDDGKVDMWLFRGIKWLIENTAPTLLKDWLADRARPVRNDESVSSPSALPGFEHNLQALRAHISNLCVESEHFNKYVMAIDTMRECFDKIFYGSPGPPNEALAWLYQLDPDFVAALQEKKPWALVIFAYFNVMFGHFRSTWYFRGWAEHIMFGIEKNLHEGYRPWLEWPKQMLLSDSSI